MSCNVLWDDEEILRLHNLCFMTLDLLIPYNSLIINKEIATLKVESYLLGCYALSSGKY